MTAPVDANAKVVCENTVGTTQTQENETTITLSSTVANASKIYVSAEDLKDNKTIKVMPDGETYEKILLSNKIPSKADEFTNKSETLNNSSFNSNKSVTLYLLKKGVTGAIDPLTSLDQEMIQNTVIRDSDVPQMKAITVNGTDANSNGIIVTEDDPTLKIEATDAESGLESVFYAIGADEKSSDEAAVLSESNWIPYDNAGVKLLMKNGDVRYVYVKLMDKVGNVSYACSKKITVDSAAPDFTLSAAPMEDTGGATVIDSNTNTFNVDKGAVKISIDCKGLENNEDEITSVAVNGKVNDAATEFAKKNKYGFTDEAGEYKIDVTVTHRFNNKSTTKSITIRNYKPVNVEAKNLVTKTYGESLEAKELYGIVPADGTDYQYKDNGAATTLYIASDENDVNAVKGSFENATPGLPKDAGSYWVKITLPSQGYFLENSAYSKVVINQKDREDVTYNGYAVMQGGDQTGKTIDLTDALAKYQPKGDAPLEYKIGYHGFDYVDARVDEKGSVTIQSNKPVNQDSSIAIPVVVTGFKNYKEIRVEISVMLTKNPPVPVEIIGANDKIYDGLEQTKASFIYKVDGKEVVGDNGVTIEIIKQEENEEKRVDKIDGIGTYEVKLTYNDKSNIGYDKKTFKVSKRPLTVSFADTTVTESTAPEQVVYPTAPTYEGLLQGQKVTFNAVKLSSEYTVNAKAGERFLYKDCPKSTDIRLTKEDGTDVTENYDITVKNGSVIVTVVLPFVPSYPSGSGGTTTTDQKKEDTKTEHKGETNPTDKKTGTVQVTTNEKGEKVAVGEDGGLVKNDVVKVDGAKYITDKNGVILSKSFAKTPSGDLVYAGSDGKLKIGQTFTVGGKKYVATKSGALVVKAFTKNVKGNTVYCGKNGAIVTNKAFKVDGKTYVATKSGALVVKAFTKDAKGNTVYCGKNGAVVTNKAFKVKGKTYVAAKSGALVKSAWIKIGNMEYYCNKNGVVTKTKKVN
ncbi:MAG: hypothetical protein ACOCM4_08285 [Acetivibrio ethanolgignens]